MLHSHATSCLKKTPLSAIRRQIICLCRRRRSKIVTLMTTYPTVCLIWMRRIAVHRQHCIIDATRYFLQRVFMITFQMRNFESLQTTQFMEESNNIVKHSQWHNRNRDKREMLWSSYRYYLFTYNRNVVSALMRRRLTMKQIRNIKLLENSTK